MNKVVVGIDVSMDDFHVCLKVRDKDERTKIRGSRTFKNTKQGFEELLRWAQRKEKSISLFVMEATGVYHENLAYFLYDKDQTVSVVLANKMKSYIKSLNVKTKTDKTDAKAIAKLGIERSLVPWKPMSSEYKKLRDMCRELLSQKKDRQRAMSQLHAFNKAHEKSDTIIKLKEEQIELSDKIIATLEKSIHQTVNQDPDFKKKIKKLETIPGLRFVTIVILICETNGFELFKNIRQVVSYAGLDVVLDQSGNHNGKTRISKKGNSRIRQALYMPAMSAIQYNKPIRKLHERICRKNPKIRQKGVVAGMRKLLILVYTLWKKDEEFDINYQWGV